MNKVIKKRNSTSDIKLHHCLHGYRNGHELVATSRDIKGPDAQILLILSDLSGSNPPRDLESYLTGYPLSKLGVYAIAKTWLAWEMPRSGCVWTHTVLIDFSDLGAIDDPVGLLSLFRRPNDTSDFSFYKSPIVYCEQNFSKEFDPNVQPILYQILEDLYSHPSEKSFVISNNEINFDELILNVWAQQWPRLKRAFRFCTKSMSDRSSLQDNFDLQVLASPDASTFVWASLAGRVIDEGNLGLRTPPATWLVEAASDISGHSKTSFRSFMRKAGADIEGTRKNFQPLASIFSALNKSDRPQQGSKILLDILLESFSAPSKAKNLKGMLFSAKTTELENLTSNIISSLLESFISDKKYETLIDGIPNIRAWIDQIIKNDEKTFVKIISSPNSKLSGRMGKLIVEACIETLPINELITVGVAHPKLLKEFVRHSPNIATYPQVWNYSKEISDEIFESVRKQQKLGHDIAQAMMIAKFSDLASETFDIFGQKAFSALINTIDKDSRFIRTKSGKKWLSVASAHPRELVTALVGTHVLSIKTLTTLSEVLGLSDSILDVGVSPWAIALDTAKGKLNKNDIIMFHSFLLRLSLEKKTKETEGIIRFTFDTIYDMANQIKPNTPAFEILSDLITPKTYWSNNDQRANLVETIAYAFIHFDLTPISFLRATKNDKAFQSMTEKLQYDTRGKWFLKKVLSELDNDEKLSEKWNRRRKILDNATRRRGWGWF